jgi:hypothetical protein
MSGCVTSAPKTFKAVSNAGAYQVACRPSPTKIVRNLPFDLQIAITDVYSDKLAEPVKVSADARMPEHYHGMVRQAVVQQLSSRLFLAKGMMFHMDGLWEVYVDIERNGVIERAQFTLVLE